MIVDNNSRVTDAVKALKQAFFACRNGVVADALRAAGDPHRYIMGCQLTDVASIVSQFSQFSQNSLDSQLSPESRQPQPDSCQHVGTGRALSASADSSHLSQNSQDSQESYFARLAQALWSDSDHRECRMAATMLYPVDEFDMVLSLQWCRSVETAEIADVLCHRLLRKLPFAPTLAERLLEESNERLVRYTAFRLLLNLVLMGKVQPDWELLNTIEAEQARGEALLQPVLTSLREEIAEA